MDILVLILRPSTSPELKARSSRLFHLQTGGALEPRRGSGLRFSLFPATRKVSECPEYRHVVPGHPPLRDLSAFDTKHCPEIKLRLVLDGGEHPEQRLRKLEALN